MTQPVAQDTAGAARLRQRLRHDLRTSLNTLVGYSELLLDEMGEGDAASSLAQIRGLGQQLLALVDEQLNDARFAGADATALLDLLDCTRDALRGPAEQSLAIAQRLIEEARGQHATNEAVPDMERIAAAAKTFLTMLAMIEEMHRADEEPHA